MTAQSAEQLAAAMLQGASDEKALSFAPRRIAETAFHDFSQYEFLSKPLTGAEFGATNIPVGEMHWWLPFLEEFRRAIQQFLRTVPNTLRDPYGTNTIVRSQTPRWRNDTLLNDFHGAFTEEAGAMLYLIYRSKSYQERLWPLQKMVALMHERIHHHFVRLGQDHSRLLAYLDYPYDHAWRDIGNSVADEILKLLEDWDPNTDLPRRYSFDPFLPHTINYGLRLVFRQTWRPLGIQPGEIVRTVPLGPKQTVKVSTRVFRRQRFSQQSETSQATESSRETSESTKDSSEVVREASEKFRWDVQAEVSAGWGWGSASVKGGMGGESAESSKNTKARLNESMSKTASRMRNESKLVVSTEGESSFEETSSSEITNPNDEIAVTYVYSRLQRQYEIATRLAEVATVVFVAEEVPRPEEVDESWIQRHAWILSKVLLDESFAADLAAVRSHTPSKDASELKEDDRIASLMDTLRSGLPNYSSLHGTLPDIFKSPQQAYEREIERKRARTQEEREYKLRQMNLRRHIIDNILHYCRAIWSAEDREQRLLRYSRIQAPVRWVFQPTGPPAADGTVPGYYAATETRPLSEVINPAGPIGYAGNYAVYYLRASQFVDEALQPLRHMRQEYTRVAVSARPVRVNGGAIVTESCANRPAYPGVPYRLRHDRGAIHVTRDPEGAAVALPALPFKPGVPLRFDGIKVTLDIPAPPDVPGARPIQDGDEWRVETVQTPFLEDPDYRVFCWHTHRPSRATEGVQFSDDVLADMADYLPEVARQFEDDPAADSWASLDQASRDLVRARFHQYMFAKEYTRRFLLETNNLLLDLDAGATPALEDFKRLHRYIDVLRALEDKERNRLENQRRQALLVAGRYADPEIERVTVIGNKDGHELVVAGDDG